MSIFAGIKNATTTNGGNYLRPGTHELELLKLMQGRTRKGVDFIAADFRVLSSTNEDHPTNSTVNYFAGADKDGFLSNVKSLALSDVYGRLARQCVPFFALLVGYVLFGPWRHTARLRRAAPLAAAPPPAPPAAPALDAAAPPPAGSAAPLAPDAAALPLAIWL